MSDFDDEPTDDANEARRAKAKPAPAPAVDDDWDDDWDDEGAGGPKRDLTLVYAVVAAAIVIVLAVVLTRPDDGDGGTTAAPTGAGNTTAAPAEIVKNWQGPVGDAIGEGEKGGNAQERATSAPGVYIWTDFQGWHVRSNRTDEVVLTVTAPQIRQKATDDYDDSDEQGDAPFQTEVTVTLPPGDGSQGIGFDLGGSESATFALTAGGQNLPATEIFLGGGDGVADANPVIFTKS